MFPAVRGRAGVNITLKPAQTILFKQKQIAESQRFIPDLDIDKKLAHRDLSVQVIERPLKELPDAAVSIRITGFITLDRENNRNRRGTFVAMSAPSKNHANPAVPFPCIGNQS